MQKLFIAIGASLMLNFMNVLGQNKENIMLKLDHSKTLLKEDKFKEAYQSLDVCYKEVGKIYIEYLEDQLLPNKITGFEKAYYSDSVSKIKGKEITIVKTYMPIGTKEGQEYLKKVIISVTNKNELNKKISDVHLNDDLTFIESGKEYSATYVDKYRALISWESSTNYMSLSFIVGASVILVEAEGFDNSQDLYQIAKSLNFENIYIHFGY